VGVCVKEVCGLVATLALDSVWSGKEDDKSVNRVLVHHSVKRLVWRKEETKLSINQKYLGTVSSYYVEYSASSRVRLVLEFLCNLDLSI